MGRHFHSTVDDFIDMLGGKHAGNGYLYRRIRLYRLVMNSAAALAIVIAFFIVNVMN